MTTKEIQQPQPVPKKIQSFQIQNQQKYFADPCLYICQVHPGMHSPYLYLQVILCVAQTQIMSRTQTVFTVGNEFPEQGNLLSITWEENVNLFSLSQLMLYQCKSVMAELMNSKALGMCSIPCNLLNPLHATGKKSRHCVNYPTAGEESRQKNINLFLRAYLGNLGS